MDCPIDRSTSSTRRLPRAWSLGSRRGRPRPHADASPLGEEPDDADSGTSVHPNAGRVVRGERIATPQGPRDSPWHGERTWTAGPRGCFGGQAAQQGLDMPVKARRASPAPSKAADPGHESPDHGGPTPGRFDVGKARPSRIIPQPEGAPRASVALRKHGPSWYVREIPRQRGLDPTD